MLIIKASFLLRDFCYAKWFTIITKIEWIPVKKRKQNHLLRKKVISYTGKVWEILQKLLPYYAI